MKYAVMEIHDNEVRNVRPFATKKEAEAYCDEVAEAYEKLLNPWEPCYSPGDWIYMRCNHAYAEDTDVDFELDIVKLKPVPNPRELAKAIFDNRGDDPGKED